MCALCVFFDREGGVGEVGGKSIDSSARVRRTVYDIRPHISNQLIKSRTNMTAAVRVIRLLLYTHTHCALRVAAAACSICPVR